MDEKTTKIVIIGVVVIAVVAIAAFFLMNNGNGGGDNPDDPEAGSYFFDYPSLYPDSFDYYKQTRLAVLGNANNDTTIDSRDVSAIKAAIKDGDISYKENNNKYAELYMYDANANGVINAEDADYVQDMIDGKAKTVYYEKLLDGIGAYSPTKKTYLIPDHRCYTRTAVLLANASSNITLVGGCNHTCTEAEFKDVIDQSSLTNIGAPANENSEVISTLAAKYSDGNVVVMTGSTVNYCKGFENLDTHASYARFITWEGDALTGLLTVAYIIDGMGNPDAKEGTGWGQAKKFESWYVGYLDEIKAESAKLTTKTNAVIGYVLDGLGGVTFPQGCSTSNTLRGTATAENIYIENAGGKNLVTAFPGKSGETSYGRVTYTLEDIAAVYQKNDLPFFIIANGWMVGKTQADEDEFGACLVEAFQGYIPSSVNICVKSWLLNGIPMAVDQIIVAKMLMPDNPVIGAYDIEKVWNEYLDLYGASRTSNLSYDNVALYGEAYYHTL